jgi:hypothetical protein
MVETDRIHGYNSKDLLLLNPVELRTDLRKQIRGVIGKRKTLLTETWKENGQIIGRPGPFGLSIINDVGFNAKVVAVNLNLTYPRHDF